MQLHRRRLGALWATVLGLTVVASGLGAPVVDAHPAQQAAAPLRVVTKSLPPFVMQQGDDLTGFSIELWADIAERIGVEYEWVYVATVGEQLAAVQAGAADAAIAGISMTAEREQVVDFSHPYFNSGLQILTRTGANTSFSSALAVAISPALLQILGVGVVIALVMAHVIWLIERHSNIDLPDAYLPGVWEGLWLSVRTLATSEYAGQTTGSFIRRMLAIIFVVTSLFLLVQFQASVTALLTVQQLTGSISGLDDLPGKRVATVSGTTSAIYLAEQNITATEVQTIDDAYDQLGQNGVDAVVYDAPVLLYRTLTAGRGQEQVVGRIFRQETYGIALPTGSPWREPINEALLAMRQDGAYDEIYRRWFGDLE